MSNRKPNRLKNYNYSKEGSYFLTINTKNRKCYFGRIIKNIIKLSEIGKIAEKCWQEIPLHFDDVVLGLYIIVPVPY